VARQYLRGVLGDGVNDVQVRADWRRRGGLCSRHWRVWRGLETPALSSTVLLRDLLAARMQAIAAASSASNGARGWWPSGAKRPPLAQADCPACAREGAAHRRYLSALAALETDDLNKVLADGAGFVCLQHLQALPAGPVRALFEGRLQQLLDDLDLFLHRSDHRHTHEPMAEAGDAWLRAMRALGGDV
jgi:hypothetical protein